MSSSRVALRYAKAFVDALEEKGRLEDHEAFQNFLDLVAHSKELSSVLNNVAIKPAAKTRILEEISSRMEMPEMIGRFLKVLAEKRRLEILPHLGPAIKHLVNERQNIQAVRLTTASKLGEEELEAFSSAMSKKLGTRVDVQSSVDPELIGGAVAQVGSLVYDGSVRGHLSRLRRQLVKES